MSEQREAVVVGGASGIGWATARLLAADGCRVTIADRNGDLAAQRAGELGDPHNTGPASRSPTRTRSPRCSTGGRRPSPPDVVVNCAGFSGFGMITDLDAEQFRSVVDVPDGRLLVLKHAGRHLREGGSVVSLTSLNARQPAIGMRAFTARPRPGCPC